MRQHEGAPATPSKASKPPSPEKAKTSKNDENFNILRYYQKISKTSISDSFLILKTSKNAQNFKK
jgi:hypothetical protein